MRILRNAFYLLLAAVVCSACGATTMEYKSLKEVDGYIAGIRAAATGKATYSVDTSSASAIGVSIAMIGVVSTKATTADFSNNFVIPFTYDHEQISSPYFGAKGTVDFGRLEIVYRKELKQPMQNLFIDAFKEAGEMPNCIITQTKAKRKGAAVYSGDDGEAVAATGFSVQMLVGSKKGAETTCDLNDARDYLEKVLSIIAGRLNRQIPDFKRHGY